MNLTTIRALQRAQRIQMGTSVLTRFQPEPGVSALFRGNHDGSSILFKTGPQGCDLNYECRTTKILEPGLNPRMAWSQLKINGVDYPCEGLLRNWIEGKDATDAVNQAQSSSEQGVIMRAICSATSEKLKILKGYGLTHGDVKSCNIMFEEPQTVRLIDPSEKCGQLHHREGEVKQAMGTPVFSIGLGAPYELIDAFSFFLMALQFGNIYSGHGPDNEEMLSGIRGWGRYEDFDSGQSLKSWKEQRGLIRPYTNHLREVLSQKHDPVQRELLAHAEDLARQLTAVPHFFVPRSVPVSQLSDKKPAVAA